jgi:hypothetical protein
VFAKTKATVWAVGEIRRETLLWMFARLMLLVAMFRPEGYMLHYLSQWKHYEKWVCGGSSLVYGVQGTDSTAARKRMRDVSALATQTVRG